MLPLNHSINLEHEGQGFVQQNGMKPMLSNPVVFQEQYLQICTAEDSAIFETIGSERSWFIRKLLRENFIVAGHKKDEFWLVGNPLLDVYVGQDLNDSTSENLYTNTRGVEIRGGIADKVFFSSRIYENQAFFPAYLDGYITGLGAVPGQGRPKQFKKTGYDFSQAQGEVSFHMLKNWIFQLGNGKHFVGHGHRSVLWSDAAFSYPYLRVQGRFAEGKLGYEMISSVLQGPNRIPQSSFTEPRFERKGATKFLLTYQPKEWLEVSLFESTIWQVEDTAGSLPFNAMRLSPVPFVSTGVYGLNGKNNVLVGLDFQARPLEQFAVYGQLALDEQNGYKMATQIGLKAFIWKLVGQVEFNRAQSNMYKGTPYLQGHSHNAESLTHPIGGHYQEVLAKMNFRHRRWVLSAQYNMLKHNTFSSFVAFPHLSQLTVPENQYLESFNVLQLEAGWIVNPVNRMMLFGKVLQRGRTTGYKETTWVQFGLRTTLRNIYYDY